MAREPGNRWQPSLETEGLRVFMRRGRDGVAELRIEAQPGFHVGIGPARLATTPAYLPIMWWSLDSEQPPDVEATRPEMWPPKEG